MPQKDVGRILYFPLQCFQGSKRGKDKVWRPMFPRNGIVMPRKTLTSILHVPTAVVEMVYRWVACATCFPKEGQR